MTEFEHQGRTDRLEAVLQAILDEQQTGILNLERGKGGVRESGSIILLYGQVFEASAGGRSGVEALKWLKTWGTCQYIFAPKAPSEIVALPPAPPTPSAVGPVASSVPNVTTSPLVAQPAARGVGEPVLAEQAAKVAETRANETRRLQYTPPPIIPTPVPEHTFQVQGQNTGPLSREPRMMYPPPPPVSQPQPPPQSYQPYQPAKVPARPAPIAYRLTQGPEALLFMERVGLTRLHRHVFLLLDGQRTAIDLVRLTRRPVDEIQHLLHDLERYGLIKQE